MKNPFRDIHAVMSILFILLVIYVYYSWADTGFGQWTENWECIEWQCLGGSCTLEEIEAYYANAPTGYYMKYDSSVVYDCYPLEINETEGGGSMCEPRDCTKQIKVRVIK